MEDNPNIYLSGLTDLAQLAIIQQFPFEQIQIDSNSKIYEGENSSIYQTWLYGQSVAIEVLEQKEQIIKQLEGIQNHAILNHPNVLILYGYCFQYNQLYLVSPFQNKGSLENCIHEINQIQDAQEKQKLILDILIDIAKGIQYLHSKQIIHRDLKPGNILLDSNFNAKICNLNYSLKQGQSSHFTVITENYSAPELDLDLPQFSEKNDIYSFGKIAYFLFQDIISQDYIILLDCIKENPEERPSADQLLDKLIKLKRIKFGVGYIIPQKENKKENDTINKVHNFIYDFI